MISTQRLSSGLATQFYWVVSDELLVIALTQDLSQREISDGDFIIEFLTIKHDNKGKPIKNSELPLGQYRTKSKEDFIEQIERFMLEA